MYGGVGGGVSWGGEGGGCRTLRRRRGGEQLPFPLSLVSTRKKLQSETSSGELSTTLVFFGTLTDKMDLRFFLGCELLNGMFRL